MDFTVYDIVDGYAHLNRDMLCISIHLLLAVNNSEPEPSLK